MYEYKRNGVSSMKNNVLDSIKNLALDKATKLKTIFNYRLEDQSISSDKKADLRINTNELKDIDYCLVNSSDLASAVNCKKNTASAIFSKYKNVNFSNNSLNILMFMNKESIIKIENIIRQLDMGELLIEKTYKTREFDIEKICKLHISYEDKKYIIKNIESYDKDISGTLNEISNKYEEYHLHNKEIRDKFIKAFSESKYELNIASPWMNNYVVNDELISKMESLLIRGASIKIIYGIENKSYFSEGDSKNINVDRIAQKLNERFIIYGDKFKIKKVNSHNKLLICDESYYIETSFNLLSFAGEYDEKSKDVRDEGATYSTNLEVIKDLRDRYFSF